MFHLIFKFYVFYEFEQASLILYLGDRAALYSSQLASLCGMQEAEVRHFMVYWKQKGVVEVILQPSSFLVGQAAQVGEGNGVLYRVIEAQHLLAAVDLINSNNNNSNGKDDAGRSGFNDDQDQVICLQQQYIQFNNNSNNKIFFHRQ